MGAKGALLAAVFASLTACGVKGPPRPAALNVEAPAAAPGDAGTPSGP